MLNHFINDAEHIYLALGATDFRKQIHSLVALVQLSFGKNPFEEAAVFLFCNKRKDWLFIRMCGIENRLKTS